MVMKMPTLRLMRISRPRPMSAISRPAFRAFWMARTCADTTDSTSMLMRLNSSKQPQAPTWARPEKVAPMVR